MAKVFYVVDRQDDDVRISLFKTEKEALTYGTSVVADFEMGEEAIEDEENGGFYTGGELLFRNGFLFSFYDGDFSIEAMDENSAKEKCENELGEDGAAIFFNGFKKGSYGYLGNGADGKDYKWSWDGSEYLNPSGKVEVDGKGETWVTYQINADDIMVWYSASPRKKDALNTLEFLGRWNRVPKETLGIMLSAEFEEAVKKGKAVYVAESVVKNLKHIKLFEQFANEARNAE